MVSYYVVVGGCPSGAVMVVLKDMGLTHWLLLHHVTILPHKGKRSAPLSCVLSL